LWRKNGFSTKNQEAVAARSEMPMAYTIRKYGPNDAESDHEVDDQQVVNVQAVRNILMAQEPVG
jgi:hypothetical protein